VDIHITRDDFWTLMDIVIVDLTCANMVQRALMTTTHVMIMAIYKKAQSYVERALGDDFIPFAIKMYGFFIFVLIHFLPLMHRSLLCVINNLF
jgi:hypothetical protein